MIPDPLSALLDVVTVLEELGLRYAIGGSVASSVHGEPRASADADLIVEIDAAGMSAFLARLEGNYYVSEDAAREALRRCSSFNIIHLGTMYKLDLFVAGPVPLDRAQLDRCVRIELSSEPARSAFVTAAEDVVLRKLDWYRQSGQTSDRQWRDVLGVLKVQGAAIDRGYLRNAADEAGLGALLDSALEQSGDDD